MNKFRNAVWGLLLVAAGVLLALNALDIVQVNIFFDGWWTVFIIVPSLMGLFTEREKTGSLIGLAIGVLLLLGCQDILDFQMLWKLLIPGVIVVIGIKLILRSLFSGQTKAAISSIEKNSSGKKRVGCATFSGCDMDFGGEVFEGAELTAVFGGIKCDLRNALITQDCVIRVSAIFGGIDILVPDDVNVKTNSTSLFGGMGNKTTGKKDGPTLYVTGSCLFGGVDIK